MKKFDQDFYSHNLVAVGMMGMVTEDGHTAKEVLEVIDDIKHELFFSLLALEKEMKSNV